MSFSDKRFTDIGQTVYLNWLSSVSGLYDSTEEERREFFGKAAEMAFEAAEEFAKVFDNLD